MAHFLGSISGGGHEVTRTGNRSSGIVATANGWNVGVRVVIANIDGLDTVQVYRTGGSNARTAGQLIATFTADSEVIR